MHKANVSERLVEVDAVRALALFGVLVMNLGEMSGLKYLTMEARAAVEGPVGSAASVALRLLLDEKSLSAFSFLFGLSFALLLGRKAGRPGFLALYARRLLALAAFGLANVAFLFWGDILMTYAALGGLLVLAARLPQSLLLTLSAALLLGVPAGLAVMGAAEPPPGQTATELRALQAFGSGSYLRAMTQNFRMYAGVAGSGQPIANWDSLNILGLFLLGLWTGRSGIPYDIRRHRPLLRRVAAVALPLGLLGAAAWVALPVTSPLHTLMLAHAPVLAVGYMALAALLLSRPRGRWLRDRLAPAGRLALSNYLLYGLIGQVVFYGWGLGLIGEASTLNVLVIALASYILLLIASQLWLNRFRMGPAEWLWRCLTYLSVQPLRRTDRAASKGGHRHVAGK
jgi:uncharacterized protein